MKILHVIPGIAPRYGGPSSAIRSMCAGLMNLGALQVEIATTDADGPSGQINPDDLDFGIPVHVFPRTRSEQWKYSPGLGRWLRGNVARFDILHLHALWTYSTYAASRAALAKKIPYIIRPAGMLSDFTFLQGPWKKWAYWNLIEKKSTASASCFHATSQVESEEVQRHIPLATTKVIANGIDDAAWKTPTDIARGRQILGDPPLEMPVILFLSRLHPKKGIIDRLIPAFEKLSNRARLVIAGGSDAHDPHYANQIRNRVAASPKARDIILLGELKGDARWAAYDAADLFVLPSHSENFGIVVAEAMSRACPVVITKEVQSCTHVTAAKSGAIVEGTVEQIAAAIDEYLRDRNAARQLGLRGRVYARSNFAWDSIAVQIKQMYDSVLVSPATA